MGAGCSNADSVETKNSITKGQVAPISNLNALSQEAQEQLKLLQAQHPEGTLGGTPSKNSQKFKNLLPIQKGDDDVTDQDPSLVKAAKLKHPELWAAVEVNNADDVAAYLSTYEEKHGSELAQAELYDETGNSVIHKAASLGHAESLMMLLERTGAKPDILNSSLATPLHLACKNNRMDSAKFLIGCGVDANASDEHGQMPLLICCIHGHFELARVLIDAHLSGHLPEPLEVDSRDQRGLSCLNCAAIKGDLKMVMLLVQQAGCIIDGASPKGCTPLLYAARGGYAEVVRFLLQKGASPLVQDKAGGTVLHHAIEKGHSNVLAVLLEHGVDVYSAIEVPDSAGRTPLFEAVEHQNSLFLLQLLTQSKEQGGFGANVNITNYNGQTPLFSAVREGNIEMVKFFVENCEAKLDLTQGELYPADDEESYDSLEEKFFMDAYKNCMTPLHVAVVLGLDELMLYLIDHGANPNLQTKIKGYSCLHLAVLANKPEIIIELVTKTQANPHLPDFGGRTLQDMIEIFIPSYIGHFQRLLENVSAMSNEKEETLMGLAREGSATVATHYVNPDDERRLQGIGTDEAKAKELYAKADGEVEAQAQVDLENMDEEQIVAEGDSYDPAIVSVFGGKIAKALMAVDWKLKEQALKIIHKSLDRRLDADEVTEELVKASANVIGLTCREKVIKVFQVSLSVLNTLVNSSKIEKAGLMSLLKNCIVERNVVLKLLQKSEEGNTRTTNKIHECLLDLSYNGEVGEALASSFILQRIQAHNRAIANKVKSEAEQSLGNYKGLLAQLALLFKFINAFGIASQTRGPLSVKDILKAVLPTASHPNGDVRNAATKIIVDVQKLSGCVTEEDLLVLPEKTKAHLQAKLADVAVEKDLMSSQGRMKQLPLTDVAAIDEEQEAEGEQTDRANAPESIGTNSPVKAENSFEDLKQIIEEKSARKDWQEREIALKALNKAFEPSNRKAYGQQNLLSEEFLQACLYLLKTCLEENNMTLYLLAVEALSNGFLSKTLETEQVHNSLKSLITPVIMHTTDTNTRVRKRSVELVNQVWDFAPTSGPRKVKLTGPRDSFDEASQAEKRSDHISTLIGEVICDPIHGEKAIIGRLGLLIKRGSKVEGGKDLLDKPLSVIMGKSYEQLMEFACAWISHKNTKIRQNSMRLVVEVCRINCMDPRGIPFKQRIINFIMGLRSGQRDPLAKKINEVCKQASQSEIQFIDVSEFVMAAPKRAASMDIAKKRLGSAKSGDKSSLPQICQTAGATPTIVLPHSEPLTSEQKEQHEGLIDMLGVQIVTCFLSKNWATRLAAIQKVQEQLHNLDPNRRDAMSSEINKANLPAELTFKTFCDFIVEGIHDPVLKNFVSVLELLQEALPTFFRVLKPEDIQQQLQTIIEDVLRKMSDIKAKIREASSNFCLWLSHQSPLGPEFMTGNVLKELSSILKAGNEVKTAAASYGNSHLIVACLSLLNQYQIQSGILSQNQALLEQFMVQINLGLKHSNPQVRKEAERFFKTLYSVFGQQLEEQLKDQKAALKQNLIQQAKLESISKQSSLAVSQPPTKQAKELAEKQIETAGIRRANEQIRDQVLNLGQLKHVLADAEEHLQALKQPNVAKKQKAVIELKKALSKKFAGNLNQNSARDLFDPLTMLMRHLLTDAGSDVYLESLSLLKFVVGSLAPHLELLDLHLMMGQFVGMIVHNTLGVSMRIQVATDKVIVFFAKHPNIGSLVVAREMLKSIERLNGACNSVEALENKRPEVLRHYVIMQLLLQQFSIILCYQGEFLERLLQTLADTLNKVPIEADPLKSTCSQIVIALYTNDSKILDAAVNKLDLQRKTPVRKIIIQHESVARQGKGYIDAAMDPMRETQMSFTSDRTSLFSPGSSTRTGRSPGGFGASQYGRFKPDDKGLTPASSARTRRMMSDVREKRQSTNTIDYNSTGPESWQKNSTAGIDLNSTGVLPKIGPPMGAGLALTQTLNLSSNFANQQTPHEKKQPTTIQADMSKFKLKSTGGAGFSSNQKSFYEPSTEQRRTPRRNLATLLNGGNSSGAPADISKMGGLGAGVVKQEALTTEQPREKAAFKPPLYQPGRRDINNENTAPSNNYKPKTGFSSIGLGGTSLPIGGGLKPSRPMGSQLPEAASSVSKYLPPGDL